MNVEPGTWNLEHFPEASIRIEWDEYCEKKLVEAAKEMALAARTAPRGRGLDQLHILVLTDNEKEPLAERMACIG